MDTSSKLRAVEERIRSVNDEPSDEPALAAEEVLAIFGGIELEPPAYVVEFYSRHNGIYHLNGFLHLLPVEEAASQYKSLLKFKDRYADCPWEPGQVPILDMNGQARVCLDFTSGKLLAISAAVDRAWQIAAHVDNCLDAVLEALDAGAFVFDESAGAFEANEAWLPIGAKHGVADAW